VRARGLIDHRCATDGRPTSAQMGGHQEAALVQEDQEGVQVAGFFLIRGQSVLIQRWMAASSRSTARRVGRWGVHPSERRRRPI
jgi:hypothetical protein